VRGLATLFVGRAGAVAPMVGLAAKLSVALMLAVAPAKTGAAEDEFYRGKTITIIVPIGPGGAYDAYARIVTRHLGRAIPGNPAVIARNMPGGGGVIASNHLYNVAPQDGTTLAIIISSFANDQLLDSPQIKYDAQKFLAVGRLVDATSVLFFWHGSAIKALADLYANPSTIGITAVNDVPAYRIRAMNRYLGTQIRLVSGYPSARDFVLASERGETDGGTSTYVGLSQLFGSYLQERRLNILVQFALRRDRAMPDIPTVLELTHDAEAAQVFRVLVATDEIGRALFTTPNVPPVRLALLRAGFEKMIADPEFLAEASQLRLPLVPRSGAELQKVVTDTFAIPADVVGRIKELIRP
jgi:tripartite-type tricarboxylate transporter receptor subunit TctC